MGPPNPFFSPWSGGEAAPRASTAFVGPSYKCTTFPYFSQDSDASRAVVLLCVLWVFLVLGFTIVSMCQFIRLKIFRDDLPGSRSIFDTISGLSARFLVLVRSHPSVSRPFVGCRSSDLSQLCPFRSTCTCLGSWKPFNVLLEALCRVSWPLCARLNRAVISLTSL